MSARGLIFVLVFSLVTLPSVFRTASAQSTAAADTQVEAVFGASPWPNIDTPPSPLQQTGFIFNCSSNMADFTSLYSATDTCTSN